MRAASPAAANGTASEGPVLGRADEAVELPDVDGGAGGVAATEEVVAQLLELSPSLFVDDVRHGSELGVDGGTDGSEGGGALVAVELVELVDVDARASVVDVDGATVLVGEVVED